MGVISNKWCHKADLNVSRFSETLLTPCSATRKSVLFILSYVALSAKGKYHIRCTWDFLPSLVLQLTFHSWLSAPSSFNVLILTSHTRLPCMVGLNQVLVGSWSTNLSPLQAMGLLVLRSWMTAAAARHISVVL